VNKSFYKKYPWLLYLLKNSPRYKYKILYFVRLTIRYNKLKKQSEKMSIIAELLGKKKKIIVAYSRLKCFLKQWLEQSKITYFKLVGNPV